MKKLISLLFILSFYIGVYGDAQSQCEILLSKSQKETKVRNYAKSLEFLLEAKTIAENNNLLFMQIQSLSKMAYIYREILDYEKAMECYLEAYQIVIKEPDREYRIEENRILNNISGLYYTNKDFGKAKEYIYKAFTSAVQLQDSSLAGGCATNLASYANRTGDLEEAEKYLNIASVMLKNQIVDSLLLLIAKGVRMENLYLKGEYNKAEQLALDILNQNLAHSNTEFKVETLMQLSRIYQRKNELQKAIKAAKEALSISPNLLISAEIYEQLSTLYLETDEPYLAIQYLKSMIKTKDSLAMVTDMANIMINQVKFDLVNSEKALAENKAKQKEERMFFIFIVAFIILSVLILVWVFRVKSTKSKQLKVITELELEKQTNEKLLLEQEKLLLEREKLLLEQRLKEQEVLSLLEQQRLNDEIDTKNRQLAAKILFQSSRNELIKEIIQVLTKIPNHSEDPILRSVIQRLKTQEKELTDWDSFLFYFEQINSSFLSSLKGKHPDLTASEIRLLSYMFLNLDTKEISKLFNITPTYFRKKKQLLSKKMKVPTSEMYSYLTNIV